MTCVKIVCDSNFKKTKDVDKTVKKVLKMFSDHFVEKMAPLSKNSDVECVYVYDNLSNHQYRLLKRLLNQNKTLLNFKEIIVVEADGKKASPTKTPKVRKKRLDEETSLSSKSDSEEMKSDSSRSESINSTASASASASDSDSGSDLDSSPIPISNKSKSKKILSDIAEQLFEMSKKIQNMSSTIK